MRATGCGTSLRSIGPSRNARVVGLGPAYATAGTNSPLLGCMNTTGEEARAAEPERAPSAVACRVFHSPRISTDWFPATVEEVTLELVQKVHTSDLAGLGPIVVILDASLAGQLGALRAAAPHAVFI